MRALLVNPRFPDAYWSGRASLAFTGRRALLPPLGLITVAALLPPSWSCRLVDMNVEPLTDEDLCASDVVLATGMLVQRDSLHEVLERCRALGVRTVVGGPCVSALPDAFPEAGHVVLGEAEEVVPALASALAGGTAGRVWHEERRPDLALSPVPRYDLLRPRTYLQSALQYSRGCPFHCEFCDITRLYGRRTRVKTAAQVVAELEAIRATGFHGSVFFVDDNFIGNRAAVRGTLATIASWRRSTRAPLDFYTEASMDLAEDVPLVDAMVAAGFNAVFLGVETPNPDALREAGKTQNLTHDPLHRIRRLLERGLDVWGGFILGFDSDGPDIFDRMIEFVRSAAIPYAMVGLLGAPPGTPLWNRLSREGRLRRDAAFETGDQFGLTNVVHRLPVAQLLDGYRRVMETLYSPGAYFDRCRGNLSAWVEKRTFRRGLSIADLRAAARAVFAQGLRAGYRREYWRFIAWTLRNQPAKLARAITQAAVGHHYISYTRQTVVPALERARRLFAGDGAGDAGAAVAVAGAAHARAQ